MASQIALLTEADIAIVTLPTVNMYLQDGGLGRTPRWRRVTPVHELRAAGVRVAVAVGVAVAVAVAVAGDKRRNQFYANGDHAMLDTFRQGVRMFHLDHPFGDAVAWASTAPADIMGLGDVGRLTIGGAADFIVMNARSLDQVIARPQSDRIVVRNGASLTATVPAYDVLDEARSREIANDRSPAALDHHEDESEPGQDDDEDDGFSQQRHLQVGPSRPLRRKPASSLRRQGRSSRDQGFDELLIG